MVDKDEKGEPDSPAEGGGEPAKKEAEPLDLSALQSLSFGTDWLGSDEPSTPRRRDRDRGGDRDRSSRRGPPRRPGGSTRPPLRDRDRERGRGGDRGRGREGERDRGRGRGGRPREDTHPFTPTVEVAFYPEDEPFNALTRAVRASGRTYELFELAQLILEKPERFVVVVGPKGGDEDDAAQLFVSVPDGLPFETEDEALSHVFKNHLDHFFDRQEVEVDPPKGSFTLINRCTITGALLGPPNYHRYQQIVQEHLTNRLPHMSREAFERKIEGVKDEEVVSAWTDQMRRQTRYVGKAPGAGPEKTEEAASAAAEDAAPADPAVAPGGGDEDPEGDDGAAAEAEAGAEADAAAGVEAEAGAGATAAEPSGPSFDTLEAARLHLLAERRDEAVRGVRSARFPGVALTKLPAGSNVRRSVEAVLDFQRRFPLDTANHLRGRLRRLKFTVYKRGSKGISFVCGVKRKFRQPGQVFTESIQSLIEFIESNPEINASALPQRFLGLSPKGADPAPAAEAAPGEKAETGEAEAASADGASAGADGAETAPAPEPAEPAEEPKAEEPKAAPEDERISQLRANLRWLVTEGYVIEYGDGRLFASPPADPPRPKPPARRPEERRGDHGAGAPARPEAPSGAAERPVGAGDPGGGDGATGSDAPATPSASDAPNESESPPAADVPVEGTGGTPGPAAAASDAPGAVDGGPAIDASGGAPTADPSPEEASSPPGDEPGPAPPEPAPPEPEPPAATPEDPSPPEVVSEDGASQAADGAKSPPA